MVVIVLSNMKRLRENRTFDTKSILGVFLDVVQEEFLDATLVEHNLLESRQTNRYIRYAV